MDHGDAAERLCEAPHRRDGLGPIRKNKPRAARLISWERARSTHMVGKESCGAGREIIGKDAALTIADQNLAPVT